VPTAFDVRSDVRLLALALLTAGLLAGCGGNDPVVSSASSSAAPTVAPAAVDPTGTGEVPASDASTGPTGASDDQAGGSGASRTQDSSSTGRAGGAGAAGSSAATGAGNTTVKTVPGIADGATALPSSATVADDGRCRLTSLRVEPVDLQGSPGGTYANFRLVNTSGSACAVRGYPGARLVSDSGKDLPTSVRHEAGPDVWVKIAKGGAAQFHLRFPNAMSAANPCNPPNAAKVRISLTGMAGTLSSAAPEGGIQACNGEVSTAPIGST
jgi:hypothetical protein